jgi:hypothetical protein
MPSFATTSTPDARIRLYRPRLVVSTPLPMASTATFTSSPARARSSRASTTASAIAPGRIA